MPVAERLLMKDKYILSSFTVIVKMRPSGKGIIPNHIKGILFLGIRIQPIFHVNHIKPNPLFSINGSAALLLLVSRFYPSK